MKIKYLLTFTILFALSLSSCGNFLDQDPDNILDDEQVFNDEVMIKSLLANFYGRMEFLLIGVFTIILLSET